MDRFNKSEITFGTPRLAEHETSGTLIRISMFAAAIAVFAAVAVPFAVNQNGTLMAFDPNEIDTITTGAIKKPVKRYHIRKSILDAN